MLKKKVAAIAIKGFALLGTPPRSFELVSTKAMPSGIILSTYEVVGPLKTA